MPYQIITDPESQVSALVEPTGPMALGPCLKGEGAEQLLQAFVDGLDQDPAELTQFELATMWVQFITVASFDPTDADHPLADEAGEGTAELEAGRDEPPAPAPADGDLSAGEQVVPSEPAEPPAEPATFAPCPNCGSTKRELEPGGAIVCATCGEQLDHT